TCMFRSREDAERAYESLARRGYTDRDVSVLMSEDTRNRCFPADERDRMKLGSKAAEGAGIGGVAGAGLGALLAGLAAAGVAVPGLPIIAIGPLAAAITGGLTGGRSARLPARWSDLGSPRSGPGCTTRVCEKAASSSA